MWAGQYSKLQESHGEPSLQHHAGTHVKNTAKAPARAVYSLSVHPVCDPGFMQEKLSFTQDEPGVKAGNILAQFFTPVTPRGSIDLPRGSLCEFSWTAGIPLPG